MFNLTIYQIGHFSQVQSSKNTYHSNFKPLVKMHMSINQEGLFRQLQPFKDLFFSSQWRPMLNQKKKNSPITNKNKIM
jgi:hypothetical protein